MRDALLFFLGIALFVGLIWAGCSRYLASNSAYERGVATALADPVVAKVLGAPVEESWFLNGSIESDGMTSQGAWLVRLRGAEGAGTLRITGIKTSGDWRVVALSLKADGTRYTYVHGRGFQSTTNAYGEGPPDILDGE